MACNTCCFLITFLIKLCKTFRTVNVWILQVHQSESQSGTEVPQSPLIATLHFSLFYFGLDTFGCIIWTQEHYFIQGMETLVSK